MRKSMFFVLCTIVIGSLILSACGAQTQPTATQVVESTKTVGAATEAPATEVAHEPVTLKYMDYSQERLDFYKEAVVEFQKEYPWITVVPETLTEDDYRQTLPLMFQGGNSPDIFVYTWPAAGDYFELADLLNLGWAQPLDDKALPADFRARFLGTNNMMDGLYSKDGKVYTVPRPPSNGVIGYAYMYYNKDIIAKAGLTDKIPTTWQEFYDACVTIKQTTGSYCFAAPTKDSSQLDRLIIPWMSTSVNGYTANLISFKTGEHTLMTDPQFVKTIEFLRSLYQESLVLPGQNDKVFSRQAVANGQAAFYFDGGWMSSVFPDTFKFTNFGVAVPPAPEKSAPGGYIGKIASGPPLGQTFISSQSKHPYEATLFLEWMTRPDGWFTQNFTAKGYDILPWGDPAKLVSYIPADNPTRDLIPLAPLEQVMAPQPSLKCPDLAKSKVGENVDAIQPDYAYSTMIEYLTNGGDWVAMATKVQDAQNKIFEETLTSEASQGLKVSIDCFKETNWDGLTNFDYSAYK